MCACVCACVFREELLTISLFLSFLQAVVQILPGTTTCGWTWISWTLLRQPSFAPPTSHLCCTLRYGTKPKVLGLCISLLVSVTPACSFYLFNLLLPLIFPSFSFPLSPLLHLFASPSPPLSLFLSSPLLLLSPSPPLPFFSLLYSSFPFPSSPLFSQSPFVSRPSPSHTHTQTHTNKGCQAAVDGSI